MRFSLTSEAGLNDALAFPFTYLAILVAERGSNPSEWLVRWLSVDVAFRDGFFEALAGQMFDGALGRMIGAFEERAHQLYADCSPPGGAGRV